MIKALEENTLGRSSGSVGLTHPGRYEELAAAFQFRFVRATAANLSLCFSCAFERRTIFLLDVDYHGYGSTQTQTTPAEAECGG
jgi:hypothetical protein